jgi:mitotic spindle assembly checkpoint protein MAD1
VIGEQTLDAVPDTSIVDARVEALEISLADLKALNESLERQLEEAYKTGNPEFIAAERKKLEETEASESSYETYQLSEILKSVFTEVNALRQTEQEQTEEIDKLEQKLFDLQGDIAAGSHVPPGVRVLQLKDNPASQWENMRKEVLDGLKKENEALLQKLARLEKSKKVKGEKSADDQVDHPSQGVPQESWDRLNREKTVLEEVVSQRDKRLLRLQQV